MTTEGDPTRGVVDIETFGNWVKGHRDSLLVDPTIERFTNEVPAQSRLIGEQIVSIKEYPWEEVPSSLQEIIAMQYESAVLPDENKRLNIDIGEEDLTFELVSSYTDGTVDAFAETYHSRGVKLYFLGIELLRGQFSIVKAPYIEKAEVDNIIKSGKGYKTIIEELKRKVSGNSREASANVETTLTHLHDVVRLLTKARGYSEIDLFVAAVQ